MKLYRISRWNDQFENNRSRTIEELSWVPIPNRHDGENYTAILANPEGAQIFSAFILMVEVASTCDPRGVLVRGNGTPHNPDTLALKTRAPKQWFECSISHLEQHTDWIESQEVPPGWHFNVNGLPREWQSGDYRKKRKKGIEEKEKKPLEFCFPLSFGNQFRAQWDKWVCHRQAYKSPKTGFQPMFNAQLEWLAQFDEKTAIEVMQKSIMSGWQGLFPPQNNGKPKKSYVPNL